MIIYIFFSKDLTNVIHIETNSLTFNFDLLNKKFDLIFIDGDHSIKAVTSDTKNAFKLLKDENSIIVWHDYGYTPERIRYITLAGIMEGCPPQFRDNIYHISNTLCAIFTRGKYDIKKWIFPEIPNKVFKLNISVVHDNLFNNRALL